MIIPLVDLKAGYESIKEEIDAAISEVISRSAFIGGEFVEGFERAFSEFCNVRHCIGVGNGTDALFIALKALGIGRGDEVIVPGNSFIATAEAVTMAGARVVFVDIDPNTYNMDPRKLEEYLKRRMSQRSAGSQTQRSGTRPAAVITVHLYGQPLDMDPIIDIARQYNLKVVEDAAQAHGAVYKGREIGSIGDMGCFSFYPAKNLGAYGDGGAITTNNDELALKARMLANHGRIDKYNHQVEGVNSRLDGLQASILVVKLKHLQEWTESRRRNAYLYHECLKHTAIRTPSELHDVKAVYHLYVVRVRNELREELQKYLKSHGISTGVHYPIALPNLKAYAYLNHEEDEFPEATKASKEILSLPMYPELGEIEIRFVADRVTEWIEGHS